MSIGGYSNYPHLRGPVEEDPHADAKIAIRDTKVALNDQAAAEGVDLRTVSDLFVAYKIAIQQGGHPSVALGEYGSALITASLSMRRETRAGASRYTASELAAMGRGALDAVNILVAAEILPEFPDALTDTFVRPTNAFSAGTPGNWSDTYSSF